ncbi:hypothetical protein Tco_1190041 [Tanacetum coccineum]
MCTRFKTMSLGFRSAHEPSPAKRGPPYGIFIINGRNLGLEDKAVFQDGSIDMCKKTTWASRTCEPYDMNGLNNNLMVV